MTLLDALPSLDLYTTNQTDQQSFFNTLQSISNAMCKFKVLSLEQEATPIQKDFEDLYLAQNPGEVLPIPIDQVFHWYWNGKVKGVFRTLQDVETNAYGYPGGYYSVNYGAFSPVDDRIAASCQFYNGIAGVGDSATYLYIDRIGFENPVKISVAGSEFPSWNDAGTAIAIQAIRAAHPAKYQIYTMNDDGTAETRITNNAFNDTHPSWVGTQIVFDSDEYTNKQIVIINDNGTGRTRLTNNAFNDTYPVLSPDGTKIVFVSDRDGQDEIYIMDSNGANQTRLTTAPTSAEDSSFPTFSKDGLYIYYNTVSTKLTPRGYQFTHMYRMDLDGGNKTLFRETKVNDNVDYIGSLWETIYLKDTFAGRLSVSYDDTRILWETSSWLNVTTISPQTQPSTGRVYMVSQWVEDHGNPRLIKTLTAPSGESQLVLYADEIPDDCEHLMILCQAQGTAAVDENYFYVAFNYDYTTSKYMSLVSNANNVTITNTEFLTSPGIPVLTTGTVTAVYSHGIATLFIPSFKTNDNLKQLVGFGSVRRTDAAGTYNAFQVSGVWNSNVPITSVTFTVNPTLVSFSNDSIISVYALPGKARWQ